MPRHKLLTCIFIEDSDDQVNLTRRLLKRSKVDLQICSYSTAEACLTEMVNSNKEAVEQSLLIADLNLGKLSGIDVIRELRGISGFSTAIMGICSASVNPADKTNARAAGADFFVDKPLDLNTLEAICRAVASLEIERTVDNRIAFYKY